MVIEPHIKVKRIVGCLHNGRIDVNEKHHECKTNYDGLLNYNE